MSFILPIPQRISGRKGYYDLMFKGLFSFRRWRQCWRHLLPAQSTSLQTARSWCSCLMASWIESVGLCMIVTNQMCYTTTPYSRLSTIETAAILRINPRSSSFRPAEVVSSDGVYRSGKHVSCKALLGVFYLKKITFCFTFIQLCQIYFFGENI